MRSYIFPFLLLWVATGCEYFQQKVESEKVPIAQANDAVLYLEDLEGLVPNGMDSNDSITRTEGYIQNWVRKQLMISRALNEIQFNEADIDRKVLDYRYSLIVHEFEKYYIKSHLDPEISEEEIQQYYEEKSENFVLKQNIIKCLFAEIPKDAPGLNNFRRNIRGYPNAVLEDITSYCFQYATKSFTDEGVWINFDEVANVTPLKEVKNQVQFLESSTYSETSDEESVYFLRILEYKISDEQSPLEFIRDDIESILVNKRKIALKKELEDAIYEEAKKNESFEVFPR